MSEHAVEPIPGLPERPPAGEEILWQGAPSWWSLARRAFHVSKVALYFGVAMLAVLAADLSGGEPLAAALISALWLLLPMGIALALLTGLAWLYARLTVYTITSERVAIRSGLALPTSINLPFSRVQNAGVKLYRDGTGDIALGLDRQERASLAMLWPHVRPFKWARPEPALRCVAGASDVSEILSDALHRRMQRRSDGSRSGDAGQRQEQEQQRSAASSDAAMA